MTVLAGDSTVSEERRSVFVVATRLGRLRVAGMTAQTGRRSRRSQRHFPGASIFRRHVPNSAVCCSLMRIKINRRLEEKIFVAEDERFAAMTRANEIFELPFAVQRRIAVAVKAEPGVAVFKIDAVVDAGDRIEEIAGAEIMRGEAATASHRLGGIVCGDRGMTVRTCFVSGRSGGISSTAYVQR